VLVSFERETEPQTEPQTGFRTGTGTGTGTATTAAAAAATTSGSYGSSSGKSEAPLVCRAVVHKQLVAIRDDATRETIVYRLVHQIEPVTPRYWLLLLIAGHCTACCLRNNTVSGLNACSHSISCMVGTIVRKCYTAATCVCGPRKAILHIYMYISTHFTVARF
jgi:hypothetical protein